MFAVSRQVTKIVVIMTNHDEYLDSLGMIDSFGPALYGFAPGIFYQLLFKNQKDIFTLIPLGFPLEISHLVEGIPQKCGRIKPFLETSFTSKVSIFSS
jgi:hypothetical protein